MVVLVIAKVDRAAALGLSRSQDGFVHMMAEHPLASKGGEESRVDVDDPVSKVVRDAQELEKSKEADEIDLFLSAEVEVGLRVSLAVRKILATEDGAGDPQLFGPDEAIGVGPGREDQDDLRLEVSPGADFGEVFEAPSSPRDEGGQPG